MAGFPVRRTAQPDSSNKSPEGAMSEADPAAEVVTACVLIIGNEILSGRTQDANLAFLATGLNEAGIRLREARVIPDDAAVIVATVNEARRDCD
jgi:molybdopterin biosynthesis enzyme MoaB